ncbi:MAG: hypothetical protein IPM76_23245 [Chloroflexi bacterium]|nr:hypothetical protein [Chloroflexota bacterium]
MDHDFHDVIAHGRVQPNPDCTPGGAMLLANPAMTPSVAAPVVVGTASAGWHRFQQDETVAGEGGWRPR